jgi:hypothetical protein
MVAAHHRDEVDAWPRSSDSPRAANPHEQKEAGAAFKSSPAAAAPVLGGRSAPGSRHTLTVPDRRQAEQA